MTLKGMRKADQQVILDGSFGMDGVPPATTTRKEPVGPSVSPLPESGPLGAARLAVPNFETNTRCVIHEWELAVRRELGPLVVSASMLIQSPRRAYHFIRCLIGKLVRVQLFRVDTEGRSLKISLTSECMLFFHVPIPTLKIAPHHHGTMTRTASSTPEAGGRRWSSPSCSTFGCDYACTFLHDFAIQEDGLYIVNLKNTNVCSSATVACKSWLCGGCSKSFGTTTPQLRWSISFAPNIAAVSV